MANYNIEISYFNGSSYDTLYPKIDLNNRNSSKLDTYDLEGYILNLYRYGSLSSIYLNNDKDVFIKTIGSGKELELKAEDIFLKTTGQLYHNNKILDVRQVVTSYTGTGKSNSTYVNLPLYTQYNLITFIPVRDTNMKVFPFYIDTQSFTPSTIYGMNFTASLTPTIYFYACMVQKFNNINKIYKILINTGTRCMIDFENRAYPRITTYENECFLNDTMEYKIIRL